MTAPNALDAAITALEAQRGLLGDAVVDAAISALRGTAPAPPSPQRLRQVTVLFVDVAESTKLLRDVDIEDAPAVLDAAVQRFADCVQAEGGLVLRYTGDGLKAAFGTQGMREDEAERAICAGLAILGAAAQHADHLRQTLGLDGFGVRVGIHTGPVVLGGGAEADRTALGDAVHVAARMEQSAPLGGLRISNETHAQVRGLFSVQAQPPLQVKGVEEPLQTWLVLGRNSAAHGDQAPLRGLEGVSSPMVGRDAERDHVLQTYADCRQGPTLRVISVLADAGLGKTRLRHEVLAHLGGQSNPPALLQARGHPGGELQAYGLLRQMLARWLSIADDLDADQARRLLVDGLQPWITDRPQARAETRAQAVGQLIGLDFSDSPAVRSLSPRDLRRTAFDALIEALHAMASRHAMVLVLDDLHWADTSTLDFIRELAQPAAVPLLVLLLSRPTLLERCPEPLAGPEVSAGDIHLGPLDNNVQSPALASALLSPLEDAPPALHRLLIERASGNPFYMEELVRMLIDDGVIDTHQRPWTLRKNWQDSSRVPSTLVGVLQARLDALPADELAALQQASIVGTVFWDSAVQAMDGRSPQALPALETRRLVVPHDSSAFAQEQERAFHHQILHDVTYGTVLGKARREGHLRVARWLAKRVANRASEYLGITAEHFEKAGDSAQALDYYDQARLNAEQRFAHDAALGYCDRALRQPALDSPIWRYQLTAARHYTLEAQGRMQEAQAVLDAMHAMAEAANSDAMRADLCSAQMLQADREGQVAEAEQLARRAIALAESSDWPSAAALGHGELAWLATMRHDHGTAQAQVALGIQWARQAATRHWREGGYAHYELQLRTIGIESLLMQGSWFEAADAARAALDSAPQDRLHDRVSLLLRLARAQLSIGELDEAVESARHARRLAALADKPALQTAADVTLACVLNALGCHAEARDTALQAEAVARAIDAAASTASALTQLSRARASLGERALAREALCQAETLLISLDVPGDLLEVRVELAWMDAIEGRPVDALLAILSLLPQSTWSPAATDSPEVPATDHALLRALQVCELAGDSARAAALRCTLQDRLQRLAAQAPDEAARTRLVQSLEHWRVLASQAPINLGLLGNAP